MSRIEIAEAVFMVLALVALWPLVFLGYQAGWYKVALVGVLLALGGMLVRRVVVMNRGFAAAQRERDAREADRPRPVLGGRRK